MTVESLSWLLLFAIVLGCLWPLRRSSRQRIVVKSIAFLITLAIAIAGFFALVSLPLASLGSAGVWILVVAFIVLPSIVPVFVPSVERLISRRFIRPGEQPPDVPQQQ